MENEEIEFNFSKLRGKIKEIFGTQSAFAAAISTNEATLSNKLNNNVEFSSKEIIKICDLLQIKPEEINEYFFSLKSSEN